MAFLGKDKTPFDVVQKETNTAEWLPYGIGIDVHKLFAFVSIAVPDYKTGQVVDFYKKTDVNALKIEEIEHWICEDVLAGLSPPFNFVIESTSTYHFPFIRHFSSRMRPIVINPALAGKDRKKTDKYDASKMAHHCMGGLWKPTPIVSGGQETLRVLTRNRLKIVANRLELTNRISTRLTQYGITFTQEVRPSSKIALETIQQIVSGCRDAELLGEYAACKPVHFKSIVDIPQELGFILGLALNSIKEIDEKKRLFDIQISYLIDTNWQKDFELLELYHGI